MSFPVPVNEMLSHQWSGIIDCVVPMQLSMECLKVSGPEDLNCNLVTSHGWCQGLIKYLFNFISNTFNAPAVKCIVLNHWYLLSVECLLIPMYRISTVSKKIKKVRGKSQGHWICRSRLHVTVWCVEITKTNYAVIKVIKVIHCTQKHADIKVTRCAVWSWMTHGTWRCNHSNKKWSRVCILRNGIGRHWSSSRVRNHVHVSDDSTLCLLILLTESRNHEMCIWFVARAL